MSRFDPKRTLLAEFDVMERAPAELAPSKAGGNPGARAAGSCLFVMLRKLDQASDLDQSGWLACGV
jgi:hypothetical protein